MQNGCPIKPVNAGGRAEGEALVGAGCSATAGIPTSAAIVQDIMRRWLWIQDLAGLPISQAIADLLIEVNSAYGG